MLSVAIIDCGSSKVPKLIEIVESAGVLPKRVALADADVGTLRDMGGCIISGGPHLFTGLEGDRLKAQFRFLEALTIPTLGICLGHQALALQAGVEVFRGEERRCVDTIYQHQVHPLFANIQDSAEFAEDHCEGVELPSGYVRIASSEFYEVEAMADDAAGRYGVQFHPEVSGAVGVTLIQNFLLLMKKGC